MQTITFTQKEAPVKGILVEDCIQGALYKCVGGFEGDPASAGYRLGSICIAVKDARGNIFMQEIGQERTISNQRWVMEELQDVTISY